MASTRVHSANCVYVRDYCGKGMSDGSTNICVVDVEKQQPNQMGNFSLYNCATQKAFVGQVDSIQDNGESIVVHGSGKLGDGIANANAIDATATLTIGADDGSGRRMLTPQVSGDFDPQAGMPGMSTAGMAHVWYTDLTTGVSEI